MSEPTETSPLLAPEGESSNGAAAPEIVTFPSLDPPIPAREYFKRPIKTITSLILIAALIDFVLVVGTDIIAYWGPFSSGYKWGTTSYLEYLGIWIFVTLIVAILNTKYAIHILLNIIFDIILAIAVISNASSLISYQGWPDYGWCGTPGYHQPGTPLPPSNCKPWKLALQILVGIAAGFGGIVGIAQLILFVLRVVAGFRTKFWKRPLGLFFPTGELTVSLTIKVLKQQPPVDTAPPAGPAVEVISS